MDAVTLLEAARAAGLTVERDGMRLVVRGPSNLEGLAAKLLDHKPDVMALLPPQGTRGSCLDCGMHIESRYLRCVPCATSRAARRPELPPPCAQCRAFNWVYDTVDLRRCVECGHEVELPPLSRDPLLVSEDGGVVSWEKCQCSAMPEGQRCRTCAAANVARWKAPQRLR